MMWPLEGRAPNFSQRLWLQDDFDAAIFAVAKLCIEVRPIFEPTSVSDYEGGIDLAPCYALEQVGQVMLDRGLSHAESESAVDRRAHRHPIEISAVHADNRNRAEVSTAMDRLTQNMRPVGS
jgi:hypothetical protein